MKKIDLNTHPKIESGFQIPADYFESLEDRILTQVSEKKDSKIISLWQKKSLWFSSIAATLLLTTGVWYYLQQTKLSYQTTTQEYLAYDSEVGLEDIATHLTDEDIRDLELELAISDASSEQFINDYL